jgi:lon-related putative ATP-dependent protease
MTRELKPEELRATCDPTTLPFDSTAELPPLDGMIGQDRAVSATAFGIGMRRAGYNLFVVGAARTGRTSTMHRVLTRTAREERTPSDYCYVYNFADPYRPAALELPATRARDFATEMARLVQECRTRLPRAFEGEEFERHKARIVDELGHRQQSEMVALETAAREVGFVVLKTPGGLAVAPAPHGEPLTGAEFMALPAGEREEIEARAKGLEAQVETTRRQLRQNERDARVAHEKLMRDIAAAVVHQLIRELRERFAGLPPVEQYLERVGDDLIAHAEEFPQLEDGKAPFPFLPPPGAFLDRYRVNVLVDRTGAQGAPVVVEPNPTHANLLGRLEHRVHFGTLVTDFTLIKPGALHQANGGYLVLEATDVLRALMAWDALKKALKSRSIRLEDPLDELRLVSTVSLAPEPIPLAVKVILIGSPLLYHLLYTLDEDFRELFKVKVDFDESLPRTPEFELLCARFVGNACREENLPHFSREGLAKLIEHSARLVGHQGRLSAKLGELLDVIREAAYWTGQRQGPLVSGEDVSQAIAQKTYRANLVEERVGRMITEGTLLIATDGQAVGQVNGISVLAFGDHVFGRPSRITARTYSGEPGVVDIEREAKLGGPIHSKGVMILTGFLAGRYAHERPLALSATIAFEQQYEEVEGDSASSAELYALLSSLTDIPLRQDLGVTGSVNQHGEIQPVGGINEKVEGFFDTCRRQAVTGRQGVLIPEANARHLMLREDVVDAVQAGRFHVFAVSTIDEGLALLSGREAGERGADGAFPKESFNAAVETVLAANVDRLKQLRKD